MQHYTPPIQDMLFILREVITLHNYQDIPLFQNASDDLLEPILEEAGKIASNTLLPLNQIGDEEGCSLKQGIVTTPKGFKEAYHLFAQGGWAGITCRAEDGGGNMPIILGSFLSEMMSSANMAFAMYPGLSHGAYSAILTHGNTAQKELYLPKLASGEWSGTMNLTEPHAGTDLGLLRTKAIPQDDHYLITGQKIFISSGDHDLTENIIHLVLARLPDAPEGIKGISLFIVPKILPETKTKNNVCCSNLEDKMGIHGNATCVMDFDAATGYLLGNPHEGLKAMFTMMNEARIGVGIQGLSQSELAAQNAARYATERRQGRVVTGAQEPDENADSIIHHANIQRDLISLDSFNEAARCFITTLGLSLDLSHHHPDETTRKELADYVSLMTPIVKGYITDKAFDLTVKAQQIFGGHGYIREWGMEQAVRDCRITMIYEGTNDIQALDLVGRKMAKRNGQIVIAFLKKIEDYANNIADHADMNPFKDALYQLKQSVQNVSIHLMKMGMKNPNYVVHCARDVMHLFGITALCFEWTKMASASIDQPDDFHQEKIKKGHFFLKEFLPEANMLQAKIIG